MQPNELLNAVKVAENDKESMAIFSGRIYSILDFYRSSMAAFLVRPNEFDPEFDINKISNWSPKGQQEYFKRVSATMLLAATEAVILGEKFHAGEHIKAAVKLQAAPVGIPGVETPELHAPGTFPMDTPCACGHAYGNHLNADKGPCLDLDCACKHFTVKS